MGKGRVSCKKAFLTLYSEKNFCCLCENHQKNFHAVNSIRNCIKPVQESNGQELFCEDQWRLRLLVWPASSGIISAQNSFGADSQKNAAPRTSQQLLLVELFVGITKAGHSRIQFSIFLALAGKYVCLAFVVYRANSVRVYCSCVTPKTMLYRQKKKNLILRESALLMKQKCWSSSSCTCTLAGDKTRIVSMASIRHEPQQINLGEPKCAMKLRVMAFEALRKKHQTPIVAFVSSGTENDKPVGWARLGDRAEDDVFLWWTSKDVLVFFIPPVRAGTWEKKYSTKDSKCLFVKAMGPAACLVQSLGWTATELPEQKSRSRSFSGC